MTCLDLGLRGTVQATRERRGQLEALPDGKRRVRAETVITARVVTAEELGTGRGCSA